ncbi:hypothetical protein Lal_00033848, partial [Lupinus albus]
DLPYSIVTAVEFNHQVRDGLDASAAYITALPLDNYLSLMRKGSSRHDLLLNSQNFFRSIPAGAKNPSLSRLCYWRLWGSRNRRALILGWAYYLDAFNSYPLHTSLPSVYRGHDNCPRWRRADIEVPKLPVDVSSWGRSACYPWSNFYLLSDDPSTRHRRITKADFRPCSTGGSCGQAPSCPCTRGPISVSPEETFARLRAGSPHLRRHVYFTEPLSETVPDRYAFRAGRNLPDKEFRYLRTIIVTIAIHRGFGRRLPYQSKHNDAIIRGALYH